MKRSNTRLFAALSCGIIFALDASAQNLVVNGDFEFTTNGADRQLSFNTDAVGWYTDGYNFIFAPGSADTTGATGQYGFLSLWGSNNGGTSEIPYSSPVGGNYIGADGAFGVSPISQTLSGLSIGNEYEVSFYWAAAQQSGFDGATTEKWEVSLGGQTISTSTYHLPNHGFSGWMQETFTFTADSVNPVLSFLAVGTPEGLPPFSLLDGVSVVAVPEPSTWLLGSFFLCGLSLRRKRSR
jgi:hypothetical protein